MTRTTIDWGVRLLVTALCVFAVRRAHAAALDEEGDIKLGVRAYTAARVATQHTDIELIEQAPGRITERSLTFPVSPAGHLRQNRFFVEATLEQDLNRLLKKGFGPLALLNDLPFSFRKLGYFLSYRGEYDGVYDYGPAEYRTAYQFYNQTLVPPSPFGPTVDVGQARQHLRNVAVLRNRLFQAYLEAEVGKLFVRFGRQILAWGETDVFRLLDNINPLDNSFGGFLIPLDERRLPLDMLLANYSIGDIGPLYEAFIEAYAAIDDGIGYDPGIPQGSPWALPNLGAPSAVLYNRLFAPHRTIEDTRGGARLNFTAPVPVIEDIDVSLASYWTYLDTPMVQTFVSPNFPLAIGCGPNPSKCNPAMGYLANTVQTGPRVQITGMATSFNFPIEWARALFLSGQPIIRNELAYFTGEQRPTQQQLDPFIYATGNCSKGHLVNTNEGQFCTGGRRYGDSWNFLLGLDSNQFIRWLNPNQSIFITTQFFYKHLNGAAPRNRAGLNAQGKVVFNGEVEPVPAENIAAPFLPTAGASQSVLIHNPIDQYLNTLLISTSYFSSQINPSMTFFYDWSGSFVFQPQVVFSRDPFRFTMSYSYLTAGTLKAASGVSLLRDRDNILFQIDYVI